MSYHETKRRLEQFWRHPSGGNPRLKGLLLAAYDGGPRPQEVGQAWPVDPEHKQYLLSQVPETYAGRRVLTAEPKRNYAPGSVEGFENTRESATARTLARDEFGDDPTESGSDANRFLKGEKLMDVDRYIKRVLLQNEVNEVDVLFRKELETTLIQGAAPRKIAREAAEVVNVGTRTGDLPRGSDETYAPKITEGGPKGTGRHSFDTVSYTCEKYADGWEISKELERSSQVDSVEFLIREAGAAVENAVNRVFIENLIDNAGQEHDTAGSNQDATMVNLAIEQVELQNYIADTMVQHPEFKTDLFEDTNLAYANRAGSDSVIRQREFNPLFGLEMFTMSDGAATNSTQTWGFNTNAEIGAVAYQRDKVALVIWSEFDMETEDYDDPIRDLRGGNVETYCDSVYRQANAAARVEY